MDAFAENEARTREELVLECVPPVFHQSVAALLGQLHESAYKLGREHGNADATEPADVTSYGMSITGTDGITLRAVVIVPEAAVYGDQDELAEVAQHGAGAMRALMTHSTRFARAEPDYRVPSSFADEVPC